ncbi:hypothetical protein P9112_000151 [Eukaryota sp. TZLM1-RC]
MRNLLLLLLLTSVLATNIGEFLVLNDVHYLWKYKIGSSEAKACLSGSGNAGKYGSHECCTPPALLNSALAHMKKVSPNPDWVAFLGDVAPQASALKHLDWSKNLLRSILRNFTTILQDNFKSTPVIPLLGNHDIKPSHQFSFLTQYIYEYTFEMWHQWIPKDQHDNYLHGGFFRKDLNDHLTILVLNTNFYFTMNAETVPNPDPRKAFKWIRSEMQRLVDTGRRALVYVHVPPGPLETFAATLPNMQPQFNSKFLDSLAFGLENDRIIAMFAGHEHSSALRLLWDYSNDKVSAPLFISPALVPVGDGPTEALSYPGNLPAFRKYVYDQDSGEVLDYYQYYLNITEANIKGKDEWKLDYKATEFFKVKDLSASSMLKAYNNLANDKAMLLNYIKQNTVHVEFDITPKCLVRHLCAIRHVSMVEFYKCYI